MSIKMGPEAEAVLKHVEEVTGTPVEIIKEDMQPHLARMSRARPGIPVHLLRINPDPGKPDYFVVYECGFVLRLYEVPPDQRFDFAGTEQGRGAVERLVKRNGQTAGLPPEAQQEIATQLIQGILIQLRSYPIGMRIDAWIHEAYPELADLQRDAVARQQQDNLAVLKPEVKRFTPKPVYDANKAMNAAYAIFSDRLFGKAGYTVPYRSAGYEKRGRALLSIMESTPSDPAHDRALVDAWAAELGMSGWYQWVPAQP